MTKLRLLLPTILLFCLPLAPAFCAPPIRCVHQTTVVKDGKATTHLIMTTAKPGEAQTAKNTADVVFPGRIRPADQSGNEISINADYSLAAINFDAASGQSSQNNIYLFISTQKQGLVTLLDFDTRAIQLVAAKPRMSFIGLEKPKLETIRLTPGSLSVYEIEGRTIKINLGSGEATWALVNIMASEGGALSFGNYEEQGE